MGLCFFSLGLLRFSSTEVCVITADTSEAPMARIRYLFPFLVVTALSASEHYGHVRSGKKPIPGATITASLESQKFITTTDETGYYRFEDLAAGKWQFQVDMFGFQQAVLEHNRSGI